MRTFILLVLAASVYSAEADPNKETTEKLGDGFKVTRTFQSTAGPETIIFIEDGLKNVLTVTDWMGRTWAYSRDHVGNLVSVVIDQKNSWQITYTEKGAIAAVVGPKRPIDIGKDTLQWHKLSLERVHQDGTVEVIVRDPCAMPVSQKDVF